MRIGSSRKQRAVSRHNGFCFHEIWMVRLFAFDRPPFLPLFPVLYAYLIHGNQGRGVHVRGNQGQIGDSNRTSIAAGMRVAPWICLIPVVER